MKYKAVLNPDQLANIPSFLEESEYAISAVLNSNTESISVLFANGSFMQISKLYFEEMGIDFKSIGYFTLSDDGQCLALDGNPFDLLQIWALEDFRIIRSAEFTIV